jgi:predicted Zn-ribbon and HTH transcriptional regulator
MSKGITSVQCTRCGHEISLASSRHMYVVKLHKCKRCGKTWFPRSPGTPRICPTCKTTHWDTPKYSTILRTSR